MFNCLLKVKPLMLLISLFSSLAVFNIVAINSYIHDTKTVTFHAIKRVQTNSPKVALTFDDGPNPLTTSQIITILKEKNAKATFFIVGKNAEAYPELVQQIYRDGHEIGNHTYTHQRMTRISPEELPAELNHADSILFNITGQKASLVRPPDNAYNATIVNLTQQFGYRFILWSIDTRDWTNASASSILREIDKAGPGDIILLHDGVTPSHTVEALTKAVEILQAKGFQLVTVSELLLAKTLAE